MLTPTNVTLSQMNSAILAGKPTHARLVFPVQTITLTDDDISADGGIVINSLLNPDTDLTMGKAVASELIVRLINGSIFNGFDWTEEFHIDFGVEIGNSTEWVTVGYFKGKKPKRVVNVETIEFSAMDRMQKFNELADDFIATLTFPVTMESIFQSLCTYCGVSYTSGDEIADVMAMSYSENPFNNGISCRDILSYIAEANCCYAKITAGGSAKLTWFSDQTSNYTLTEDDHFGIELDEENTSVIDSVRISSTEDETAGFVYPISGNNVIYQIVDNPLLLSLGTSDRTTALTDIVARLAAFGAYTPGAVNAIGNFMVETGDIIAVEHSLSQTVNFPIFVRGFAWNGGCGDVYECTGNVDREMTSATREQYAEGGKLANKYDRISGIDITDDGIDIYGNKYLKLRSGGVVDIQSTNFVVDSANKLFQAGNWKFNTNGFTNRKIVSSKNIDFHLGKKTADSGAYITGFMYFDAPVSGNYRVPALQFGAIDVGAGQSADMGFELTKTFGHVPTIRAMSGLSLALGDSTRPIEYINATVLDGECREAFGNVVEVGTINNSSYDIEFLGNVNCLICVFANSENRMRMCMCRGRGTRSDPIYYDFGGGSNITFSVTSSHKLRVKNSASYDAYIVALAFGDGDYIL